MESESLDLHEERSPTKFSTRSSVLSPPASGHVRVHSMPLPLGDLSNRRSATPARVPTGKKVGFAHPNHTHSIPRPRAQSYTAPEPRLELTDFELLKKIGQGGFGEVYLVRKKDTSDVLALKIMEKSLIWKKNKIQQIKNERDVLARGLTSRMVRLHYSFQDRLYLYLAMEYCPGGDLQHLLNSWERLEESDAQLYMAEMVAAVHALHQLGYIHRDLKPDNFLIDRTGHLKLADFGLTKEGVRAFATSPSGKEVLGIQSAKGFSVVGSPDYMAPEVLQRSPSGYGQEVDWWSLGCVFFDMVAGYPPFNADSAFEVFDNIANWEVLLPDIIEQHWDFFSPNFINLLLNLLCAPEHRLGKDIDKIYEHPFFEGIDWDDLESHTPLFVPAITDELDVKYFSDINPTPTGTPATPSKRRATSNFQAYYKHKMRSKEESERRLAELQARSFRKMVKAKEKRGLETQPPHFVSPPPNFHYDFTRSREIPSHHRAFIPSPMPEMNSEVSEIPSWATPMKGRWQLTESDDDEVFLIKTRSTPVFATPTKAPFSPDKQIAGFTFQRKSARKSTSSRVAHAVVPSAIPSMKLDLFEEDEESAAFDELAEDQ